ncbi:MAG: hypothetical protein EBT86_08325 [Actinobacteria bacterium]|nr:hypothetical protein [Actinomycetota bacterium]
MDSKMNSHYDISESALGRFLGSHRAPTGRTQNVNLALTGMGVLKGRWIIPDEEYSTFLDLLHDYLFIQKRRPLNLVEQRRANNITPLLIDLDLKYDISTSLVRRFHLENIRIFIRNITQIITEFIDLGDLETLRFFVPLRPTPYEDKRPNIKQIKDGIHIECPDLSLQANTQQVIRYIALKEKIIETAFENCEYINKPDDIYDESLVKKNGWFLYGEGKPDLPPYDLALVYCYNIADGLWYDANCSEYTARELMGLLSIRQGITDECYGVRSEKTEEWNALVAEMNPTPVNPIPNGENPTYVENSEGTAVEIVVNEASWYSKGYSPQELQLYRQLATECLSVERADSFSTWMEVGWCLHNIDQSEDMFNTWMEFSQKSSKFSANNISQLKRDWFRGWGRSTYQQRRLTERSLHMWAKNDNPTRYEALMKDSIINYILESVDKTHTHIGRLIQKVYAANIRCHIEDKRKVAWYEWTGNGWQLDPQGIHLRKRMTTEIASLVDETKQTIRRRVGNMGTEVNQSLVDLENSKLKRLHEIEGKLYSSDFKSSVLKECEYLFHEPNFLQNLDNNPYLIGVANGVIDLRAERIGPDGKKQTYCEFRQMRPEDYISFMCGRMVAKGCEPIDYIPYNPEDPEQGEIDDFMCKVFPDTAVREYMWRKLASCLEGANREQRYDTWIGVGGNGKSKLVDLVAMTLGDYATSLQSTALTRKRPDSGAANPDIIAVWKKRFIYLAEPDDGEPLNTSRMKQFTGEDIVEARGLFEDQQKFKITGKLFMLCNRLPPIYSNDRGTWRRVITVPFVSKFVDPNGEEAKDIDSKKNIYPRDNNMDEKLVRWRSAFLARLIHVYETQYMVKGIEPIPDVITAESRNYRAKFDTFGKFMADRIRSSPGEETTIQEAFRAYKTWHKENSRGTALLALDDFTKRMEDEFGQPADRKTFKRIIVFREEGDVEAYDAEQKEQS